MYVLKPVLYGIKDMYLIVLILEKDDTEVLYDNSMAPLHKNGLKNANLLDPGKDIKMKKLNLREKINTFGVNLKIKPYVAPV